MGCMDYSFSGGGLSPTYFGVDGVGARNEKCLRLSPFYLAQIRILASLAFAPRRGRSTCYRANVIIDTSPPTRVVRKGSTLNSVLNRKQVLIFSPGMSLSVHFFSAVCSLVFCFIYPSIHIYWPIYLSFYPPIDRSSYLAIYQSINQSINQSTYQSISLSIWIYLNLSESIWIYISESIWIHLNLSLYLSIYLNLSLFLSESIWIYLSICLNLSESIWIYLNLSESIWIYLNLSESIWIYLNLSLNLSESISQSIWI